MYGQGDTKKKYIYKVIHKYIYIYIYIYVSGSRIGTPLHHPHKGTPMDLAADLDSWFELGLIVCARSEHVQHD